LLKLWREDGLTVVFVTHSVYESTFLSTRIITLTAAAPDAIASEIRVQAPHVRTSEWRSSPEFAASAREVFLGNSAAGSSVLRLLLWITSPLLSVGEWRHRRGPCGVPFCVSRSRGNFNPDRKSSRLSARTKFECLSDISYQGRRV
jgi:hypothetical protein